MFLKSFDPYDCSCYCFVKCHIVIDLSNSRGIQLNLGVKAIDYHLNLNLWLVKMWFTWQGRKLILGMLEKENGFCS